ncbi:MAG: hypothetical protein Q9169_001380 [Polycauliona sp. 2 TL-2023]
MSQAKEYKSAVRHGYNGNLATQFDPSIFGKITSKGADSTKAAGTNNSANNKMGPDGAESSKAADSRVPLNAAAANRVVSNKVVMNSADSTKTAIKQNQHASTAPKTREQKIAEALGPPPQPKGTIRDGKLTWTPPANQQARVEVPAGSASQTSKFPCPYPDCKRGFLKEGDLRKHKFQDHDYCKICDEDFEDDEAFHKHKIMSERHITCTVCSLDFRSESGRDRHYKMMHASAHNVKCRGCDEVFAKGAALLLHFEKDLCRPIDKAGISASQFEAQRSAMAMVLQTKNLDQATTASAGGSLSRLESVAFGGSVAGSSVYGGVAIEPSEQPDFLTDHGREGSQASDDTERPRSPSDDGTDLLSFRDDPRAALNASNLAALNRGRLTKGALADWPELGSRKTDVVQGMSNISLSGAGDDMSPGIYAPPSVQPSKSGFTVAGEMKGIELQPNPISGEWECPYHRCE